MVIPIVYATDDKTVSLCSVSIASIIGTANKENMYVIYVLYSRLTKNNISNLEKMSISYVKVKCINVTEYIDYASLYEVGRYPYEMYYRLYASLLVEYEKIIYLDCDTLVLDDIVLLYREELKEAIGVVTDYCYYLGGNDYFNSGVLLINRTLFEEEKIRDKCLDIIKKGKGVYLFPDQDALNMVCKNNKKVLRPCFNYQMHVVYLTQFIELTKTKLKKEFSFQPVIVHYSYLTKPHRTILSVYNSIFWKYAKKTSYYEELVCQYLESPYDILRNSFLPEMYLGEVLRGEVGLSKIVKIFLYSIKYWFLYKIRGEKNESKRNDS